MYCLIYSGILPSILGYTSYIHLYWGESFSQDIVEKTSRQVADMYSMYLGAQGYGDGAARVEGVDGGGQVDEKPVAHLHNLLFSIH